MKREMTNKEFAKSDQKFIDDCQKANVEPTARQASKYRMKKGKAYAVRAKI
jgi:hypothetical protein